MSRGVTALGAALAGAGASAEARAAVPSKAEAHAAAAAAATVRLRGEEQRLEPEIVRVPARGTKRRVKIMSGIVEQFLLYFEF